MYRISKLVLVLTTLILLSFAVPAVNAGTIVVGIDNDLSRYPFGREPGADSDQFPNFTAGGIYQQVYISSAFSGPITITQIAFASKGQLTSGPGTATYNFNLALSTTAAGPGTLSTNLAANRGTDFAQVFSGPVTATLTATDQFDLVIDVVPFTYDPALGNLLIEVVFNSPMQFTGGPVLYFNATSSSIIGRAANPTGSVGGAFTTFGFGLQTRFTTKATAQVTLGNLEQTFDGSPKSVAVTSDPPGLEVVVTYNGSATPPTNAGIYAVAAIVNDPNFVGRASGNLIISTAAQQITFDTLSEKTFGDADFDVSATASSNLAVSFAASGQCTITGSTVHLTGAGSCQITASQSGDSNFNAATDVERSFRIAKAATETSVTSSTNPSAVGQSVTFTATVTSAAAGLTGTVTFKDGGNAIATCSDIALSAGQATCSTSALSVGSHTITADYSGDANFDTLPSNTLTQEVVSACTNTSTVITNNDISVGSLRAAIAGTCPNGTVDFDVPGTGPLNIVLTDGEIVVDHGLTIRGPIDRSVTISGNNSSRVFNVTAGSPSVVTISNLTIASGNAGADVGGAIANNGTATLNLFNSTLSGNQAQLGGAIYNSGGIVNVTNSTLSDNTATNQGGGIYQNSGTINVLNSTVTANTALGEGGGIYQSGISPVNIRNSIVALNDAATGPDLFNAITSQGHNIVGSIIGAIITPASGDQLGVTAAQLKLGTLANHGGPTRTHALLSGSPAIDAGDNTAAAGLTTDQRGHARRTGSAVDIGAYEAGGVTGDFDRDLLTDVAVWRPATGEWLIIDSSTNLPRPPINWGAASLGDIPVPGDYDGDGKTDVAVFRPSEGVWYINRSSDGQLSAAVWGLSTDTPVPGDYDGDGKTDVAIVRNGQWYINRSSDGQLSAAVWGFSTDKLVPGDYDGDGKTDVAVFRPSDGTWYISRSTNGQLLAVTWGLSTDKPVPADYDGDGKTDIAVYRNGVWHILQSLNGVYVNQVWGLSTDTPVPADYDGDGKMDVAVFRPSDSNWYIVQSSDNSMRTIPLGASGDVPVPSAYIP